MQVQQLCLPGPFSIRLTLPGHVDILSLLVFSISPNEKILLIILFPKLSFFLDQILKLSIHSLCYSKLYPYSKVQKRIGLTKIVKKKSIKLQKFLKGKPFCVVPIVRTQIKTLQSDFLYKKRYGSQLKEVDSIQEGVEFLLVNTKAYSMMLSRRKNSSNVI